MAVGGLTYVTGTPHGDCYLILKKADNKIFAHIIESF